MKRGRFWVPGWKRLTGSAIASSSSATERVKVKTVEEALIIKNTDVTKELCLPLWSCTAPCWLPCLITNWDKNPRKERQRSKRLAKLPARHIGGLPTLCAVTVDFRSPSHYNERAVFICTTLAVHVVAQMQAKYTVQLFWILWFFPAHFYHLNPGYVYFELCVWPQTEISNEVSNFDSPRSAQRSILSESTLGKITNRMPSCDALMEPSIVHKIHLQIYNK